jgi:hypothetical protein
MKGYDHAFYYCCDIDTLVACGVDYFLYLGRFHPHTFGCGRYRRSGEDNSRPKSSLKDRKTNYFRYGESYE